MQKHYLAALKRIFLLMCCYTTLRFMFLAANWLAFQKFETSVLANSLVLGLRFDLSVIALINIFVLLFSLIPVRFIEQHTYQKGIHYLFFVFNLPFLWLSIADFEYYKFIGRRTNFSIFGIANDAFEQSVSLMAKYWHLSFFFLIASIFFYWFSLKIHKNLIARLSSFDLKFNQKVKYSLYLLLVLGLGLLAFRGGFQTKPLRVNDAFSQNSNQLGNLVLNSPFTFLKTSTIKSVEKELFFADNNIEKYLHKPNFEAQIVTNYKQNIVVIIVESLAKEYLGSPLQGSGYTPFLDSLSKVGLSMENHFANGRESIDAVPAIAASIPRLIDDPFITSMYQANKIVGLPEILNNNGYNTSFYHGAKNGSMGFEAFSHVVGYQQYNGLSQYKNKADFDGQWGIFDEPYLQYFADELSAKQLPFFSTIFTLSSHVPYTIPAKHLGRFPKGNLPIHESLGYADFALKLFFEKAKTKPWFKNTLFIITGDHTQQSAKAEYQTEMGVYNVPLILYHADNEINNYIKTKVDETNICQHTDIMPTVLDYLAIKQNNILPFGISIFEKNYEGFAINYSQGISRFFSEGYLSNNKNDKFEVKYTMPKKYNGPDVKLDYKTFENRHKALLQYYRNGLVDNNWYK
jgi:phosphoglycerol transferase MdoB-like AlkP superfamily enzyme